MYSSPSLFTYQVYFVQCFCVIGISQVINLGTFVCEFGLKQRMAALDEERFKKNLLLFLRKRAFGKCLETAEPDLVSLYYHAVSLKALHVHLHKLIR